MGEQRIEREAEGFVVEQVGFGRIGMWVTIEGEGYMQRERICKAVSCHEEFVEALDKLITDIDNRAFRRYLQHPVLLAAREALAKAKA